MADPRRRSAIAAVAVLGVLAPVAGWLADRRPLAPELQPVTEALVVSSADSGPGSLREAIFAAARSDRRFRLTLRVPRIEIVTPLPPLLNLHGVVIDGGPGGAVLDASGLTGGPALDLHAPDSSIRRLTLEGAPETGILVHAPGVRIESSTLRGAGVGVESIAGADGLTIEGSLFEGNRIGVRLGDGAWVRGNRLADHAEAGVWAVQVRPRATVRIEGNRFRDDATAVVAGDAAVTVADNDVDGARETAILVMGRDAAVRRNRVRRSRSVGIFAASTSGAEIVDNEIDNSVSAAVLLHSATGGAVRGNRCHANGYGIAVVFGGGQPPTIEGNLLLAQRFDGLYLVGASPLLRANRVLGSGQAGLRLLEFVPLVGEPIPSRPLASGNVFEGNGSDGPLRGVYHEEERR